MLRATSREPLFAFRLSGQKGEDTRALEDLAHPGTGVGNPQPAVHGRRHVERSDELAHSGGIDPGDRREIEDDRPFTLPKQARTLSRADRSTGTRSAPSTATTRELLRCSLSTTLNSLPLAF